jgi:hypothetical protein
VRVGADQECGGDYRDTCTRRVAEWRSEVDVVGDVEPFNQQLEPPVASDRPRLRQPRIQRPKGVELEVSWKLPLSSRTPFDSGSPGRKQDRPGEWVRRHRPDAHW